MFYGDCRSGVPGKRNERNFAEINTALRRMSPAPEFVVFLGDHIAGYESYPEALLANGHTGTTRRCAGSIPAGLRSIT